jgi:hypothetical protein
MNAGQTGNCVPFASQEPQMLLFSTEPFGQLGTHDDKKIKLLA